MVSLALLLRYDKCGKACWSEACIDIGVDKQLTRLPSREGGRIHRQIEIGNIGDGSFDTSAIKQMRDRRAESRVERCPENGHKRRESSRVRTDARHAAQS